MIGGDRRTIADGRLTTGGNRPTITSESLLTDDGLATIISL
jgi:hypothetical protein